MHVCVNRQMGSSDLKSVSTYPPPPNPYISETAFSHRFQKAYTYPHAPLRGDMFAHWGKHCKKKTKKWQNAQSWHKADEAERY